MSLKYLTDIYWRRERSWFTISQFFFHFHIGNRNLLKFTLPLIVLFHTVLTINGYCKPITLRICDRYIYTLWSLLWLIPPSSTLLSQINAPKLSHCIQVYAQMLPFHDLMWNVLFNTWCSIFLVFVLRKSSPSFFSF